MPQSTTISTIGYLGALGVVALAIFGKISMGKGLLIGGGLAVVGLVTQPNSTAFSA